jgi:hypothetical protein
MCYAEYFWNCKSVMLPDLYGHGRHISSFDRRLVSTVRAHMVSRIIPGIRASVVIRK